MAVMTFFVLAISIVFLTVAGGGLFPATVGIAAVILGGMACLSNLKSQISNLKCLPPRLELIMAAILLFILLMAMPIPPWLDSLAGPLRHHQHPAVVTAFHDAAKIGVPAPADAPWFALTRNRAGTRRFFLLLASALGAFMLTSSLPARWRMTHLYFLAVMGACVGFAGWLGQWKIPQGDTLWWFIPIPHAPTSPVGCFVNRNHFGGFVAMLSPIALALAHHAITRRRWPLSMACLILAGIMMATVCLSLSRGALLAMGAGLTVTSLAIAFHHRTLWGILLLALVLAGGGGILATTPAVQARLTETRDPTEISSVQSRLAEWRESLRVLPHYPVLGAGMNALRMVYPQYRQTSVSARLLYAENEYVQLLAEGGLVGLGLAVAFVWAFHRRIRDNSAPVPGVILVAVSGSITVTAVHCLFDFPAHLPLYALVLGSLAGLLLSTPAWANSIHRRVACIPAVLAVSGTLLIATHHPELLKTMDDPGYLYTAKYRDLHRALSWAPTSSPAWLYLGRAIYREGANRQDVKLCIQGEAFMTYAAELDPQNYRLWFDIGKIRLDLKDFPRAKEAFQRAHQLRSWLMPPKIPEGVE